ERVVFALGIRMVGEQTAKILARHFKTIEALRTATVEQLTEVDGIGGIIAVNIVEYFHDTRNIEIVDRLISYGLQMSLTEEQQSQMGTALEGKSIVISGVFTHHSRDEYKDIIERNGGKNVGSISKKTSFVLAGENMGPSKLEKAQKLGVQIMSEEEFLQLIMHNS
ncbi:MAG: NAD-dependent DNA ligase LigA, partial [Paludibacteraceae bacterium]|nr:NAD-dependent DNA ligase LigA [Paludibacteraceae bacterium]